MAEINKGNLATKNGSEPDNAPSAKGATVEYGPSVRILLNGRMLGNSDILRTIGKFDPTYVPMDARLKMREDVMIKLGLKFISTPILNADYHFESTDRQITAFADKAYRQIHVRLCTQILTALAIGYAGIVQRFARLAPDWEYEDENGDTKPVWPDKIKAVVWNEFEVLPPRGLVPVFAADGRTFIGMNHPLLEGPYDPTLAAVPASHSLWFTHDKDDSFGDWYGRPRTQSAYRYWWSYWYQWLLADRHAEMDADPPLLVRVPANEMVTDPDDPTKEISAVDLGMRIGTFMRDGATVVLPSDVFLDDEGKPTGVRKWDAEFIRGGENLQAFRAQFEYMDVMKIRGTLVPEQSLGMGGGAGGGSSRNVAGVEVQQVEKSIELLMGEIDQLINDVLLPPLIRQNFVDPPSVRKVTTGFRPEDLSLLKQIVTILAQNDPASLQLDIRSMLKKASLPLLTPEQAAAAAAPPPPPAGGGGNLPAVEGQASPNAAQGGAPEGNNNSQGGVSVPGGQAVVDANTLAAALPEITVYEDDDDPVVRALLDESIDLVAALGDE